MASNERPNNSKPNMTSSERMALLQFLLQRSKNGSLVRGAVKSAGEHFNVSVRTVSTLWKRARESTANGSLHMDVLSRKKTSSGRKPIDLTSKLEKMADLPLSRRGTLRSISCALDIPLGSLSRSMKSGEIRRHSSAVKPFLTPDNMTARLKFALDHTLPSGLFEDMYDHIHIDEKWFYMSKTSNTYYLLKDEAPPHRTCKSKRYIEKVMFLAAVSRPKYDHHTRSWFDGKIGIWPYVYEEPAKRSSKNRAAGTMVTKNVQSITAQVHREMMVSTVIPAIKEKWPASRKGGKIYIQQDNAKPHTNAMDAEIEREGCRDGWTIEMKRQPANSPDLNVLDLGFFNAIQSLQHEESPRNVNELIDAVGRAFQDQPRNNLDNVFLSLQQAMMGAMSVGGGNSYTLAHMGKEKLRREELLPVSIMCPPSLLETARAHFEGTV
jgi:hypothetical protein